jgi:hypothetical protein
MEIKAMAEGDTEIRPDLMESDVVDLEETDVFLDAIAARHRMEFDPAQAKAIGKMFQKAAQIVEESRSIEADKPAPRGATPLRIKYSDAWTSAHRFEAPKDFEAWQVVDEVAVVPMHGSHAYGGPVTAAPYGYSEGTPMETPVSDSDPSRDEISAFRILLVGGIPVATTISGVLLLIASAAKNPIVPNPYIALFTFLVGLAFIATAVAAIRERQRD